MKLIGILVAGSVAISAGPLAASQPYSQSLVECAVIHDEIHAFLDGYSRSDRTEELDRLRAKSDAYFDAAIAQATKEGIADPVLALGGIVAAKRAYWSDRMSLIWVFSQEAKDWGSYCRKFARHLGLDLP